MKSALQRGSCTEKGFSLVSVMLLLVGMAMVSAMKFRDQGFRYQIQRATHAGQQMRMLNDGLEGYLISHVRSLTAMKDDECFGVAGCTPDPAKLYCVLIGTTGNQCDLNLERLVVEGYLPPNWKNINAWGSAYKVVVTRTLKPNAVPPGNPIDYNIRAISVTQTPWSDSGGNVLLGLLGQAVKEGGADMAMTSSVANIAQGLVRRSYNATMTGGTLVTWNADNSMNPWINGIGQLVGRAGFESAGSTASAGLLRRDGSRAMKNDLNLGSQRVNNTQDAFVKKISGGRNLAAVSPTWVFKYSWRVSSDGATIHKPDCRVESGGWSSRTSLTNPWDPTYSNSTATAYDEGEPRILVVNDTLKNLKALGYSKSKDPSVTCAPGLSSTSSPATSSCPASDPYTAYDPAFMARGRGAYSFSATDVNASEWIVNMRYHQDDTTNTAADPSNAQGIASVYCYYDSQVGSGCNGEQGCVTSGAARPAGSAAVANLDQSPSATTKQPYQSLTTSGTSSELQPGVGAPGAADTTLAF